jgi:hypothetical protein
VCFVGEGGKKYYARFLEHDGQPWFKIEEGFMNSATSLILSIRTVCTHSGSEFLPLEKQWRYRMYLF